MGSSAATRLRSDYRVGANIGTTTIPFALAGYEVIAVEPVPATFKLLRTNIERNGLTSRVRCVHQAISDSALITMHLSDASGNAEVAGVGDPGFVSAGYALRKTVEVPGGGLAELLGRLDVDPSTIALVWSDTQGSEPSVVRTGAPLWKAEVPLFAEFWPVGLEKHGGVGAFVDLLAACFRGFVTTRDLDHIREIADLSGDFTERLMSSGGGHEDVLLLPSIS